MNVEELSQVFQPEKKVQILPLSRREAEKFLSKLF